MLPWATEERSPVSATLMQANSLATSDDWNSPEDAQKSTNNEPNHARPWLDSLITKHKPHEVGHGEAASPPKLHMTRDICTSLYMSSVSVSESFVSRAMSPRLRPPGTCDISCPGTALW